MGDPFYFLERQFIFSSAARSWRGCSHAYRRELWDKYGLALLLLGLLLLALVLIPGLGRGQRRAPLAADRGAEFPGLGAREGLVLTWLCSYCVRKHAELEATLPGLAKPFGLLSGTAVLLLIEPDFGAATVLFATGFGVLFIAGARLRYVALLVSTAVLAFALLALTSPYRLKRLMAFLHPLDDPFNGGFQLTQSLIAIGRGCCSASVSAAACRSYFICPKRTRISYSRCWPKSWGWSG